MDVCLKNSPRSGWIFWDTIERGSNHCMYCTCFIFYYLSMKHAKTYLMLYHIK